MTTKAPDTNKAEDEVIEKKVDETPEDKFYEKEKVEEKEIVEEKEEEKEEKEEEKPAEKEEEKEEKKEKTEEKEEPKELSKEDLKLSKDSKISDEKLDEIVQFTKEQGLSKEQAQAHLEEVEKVQAEIQQENKQALDDAVNEWTDQAEKDKEFGGDKYKESVGRCNALLSKFFSPKFTEMLAETGYSNHPELIRGLNRIGKTMDSDELVISSSQTTKKEIPIEDVFYGDTSSEKN